MKQLLQLLFLVFSIIATGQCPDGNITLASQDEIDAFALTYPDCIEIVAALTISGDDITNLNGLNGLTKLGSRLVVENNPLLVNFSGLENVSSMGTPSQTALQIVNNPLLGEILGLSNLVYNTGPAFAGFDLDVINNPALQSLSGLEGVSGITFNFLIVNNDALTNLSGLNNITNADDFIIQDNDNLVSFAGLENMDGMGLLSVENNASLIGFEAFTDVSPLCGVRLVNNPVLEDISGFNSEFTNDCLANVIITGNPNLSDCASSYICQIFPVADSIEIMGNAEGCNSQEEVEAACPVCPDMDITIATQAEIDAFSATYPNCTQFEHSIYITGEDITNLLGLAQIETVQASIGSAELWISDNPNLTSLEGLNNLSITEQGLLIDNNPLITSLQGLERLETSFDVRNNAGLLSLDGIDGCQGCFRASVTNNASLTDISALNIIDLNVVSPSIVLQNNGALSMCNIDVICDLLNQEFSDVEISNNGPDCEYEDVFEQCVGCPFQNITLNTQAEVNAFPINFPTCTEVQIVIDGSDITDLTALQQITATNIIVKNTSLTSLAGLENVTDASIIELFANDLLADVSALGGLTGDVFNIRVLGNQNLQSISGWDNLDSTSVLDIKNNVSLQSISGLQTLSVTEILSIEGNASLLNLDGLEQVVSLTNLDIEDNAALEDISALSNLTGDLNTLHIVLNNSLQNINGLEGIETVHFNAWVKNNTVLENVNGLSGLTNTTVNSNANIQIEFNSSLTDISGIQFVNASTTMDFRITNNPLLSECAVLSVCEAIAGGQNVIIGFNNTGCQSVDEVEAQCGETINTIEGVLAYDFNNDGCETGFEAGNILINAESEGQPTLSTFTTDDGSYRLQVPEGSYTISVQESSVPENFVVTPDAVEVVFTSGGATEIVDFCMTSTSIFNDLKVVLVPTSEARPGFESTYSLFYENRGTTILSGTVSLQFNETRQDYVSGIPAEASIGDDIITWDFENLLPLESRSITVTFLNEQPPVNNDGDILGFQAIILPSDEDSTEEDNIYDFEQIMVNSFDPNDKQVSQGDRILEEEVGDYLDYVVRFQNTGSADAINIRIEDVLSENLDVSSVRTLGASHDFRLDIIDGTMLSFVFEDINLPPQEQDEEASQGYVAFQVRSLSSLVLGDSVENTASIFFDFNEPIITNTVITTVSEPLGLDDFSHLSDVKLYPNPTQGIFSITLPERAVIHNVSVISISGKEVLETSDSQIDISEFAAGIYFIKIYTSEGLAVQKLLKQ